MRRFIWLSLLISLFSSHIFVSHAKPFASSGTQSPTSQDAPDADEYSVYAALLKEMFIRKETKQLVIKKLTTIDEFSTEAPKQTNGFSSLSQQAINDFKTKNKQAYELNDQFKLDVKINFIRSDELNKLFQTRNSQQDGWMIFNQQYPTAYAIITLSRVGFNKERNQALIFVAFGCGWLCGEGNYILLTKKDGMWKIEAKSMTWIS
jgi:hypothetical protein